MKLVPLLRAGLLASSTLFAVSLAADVAAQVPAFLPVQGVLADGSSSPISAPGGLSLTFRLYNAPVGGALLHQETQVLPVEEGLFHAYLGDGTPLDLTLFVSNQDVYLGVQVGAEAEMAPRAQLGTVAYAAMAGRAAAIDWTAIDNRPPGLDGGSLYAGTLPLTVSTLSRVISLSTDGCADGATWVRRGAGWACELPSTPLAAGPGIALVDGVISADGTWVDNRARAVAYDTPAELRAVLDGTYQQQLTGSCPNGIASIAPNGAVTCAAASGGVSAVTGGGGITGSIAGGTLTLGRDSNTVQTRIGGVCPEGQAIRAVDSGGGVTCGTLIPTQVNVGGTIYGAQAAVNVDCAYGIRILNPAGGVACADANHRGQRICDYGFYAEQVLWDGTVLCRHATQYQANNCRMFIGQCDDFVDDPNGAPCNWAFASMTGSQQARGGGSLDSATGVQAFDAWWTGQAGVPIHMAKLRPRGAVDGRDRIWVQYICPWPADPYYR